MIGYCAKRVLLVAAGKDVFWYTKAAGAGGVSNDELEAVKQQERDMMAEVRRHVYTMNFTSEQHAAAAAGCGTTAAACACIYKLDHAALMQVTCI
jgi:hypothetical protein